jgi:ribonucleoside-diphosphate reductase alpha chain
MEAFKQDIQTAMQMIDNLVDIELELIEKIQSVCDTDDERELWSKLWQAGHDGRRTGLGTHGLGDMLSQLNIKYDSQEALDFADSLYRTLRDTAYTTSIDLAEIRGSFPAFDWNLEKNNEYIRDLPEAICNRMAKVGRRNISILTQAPTGSVSLVSKCGEFPRHNISSGVEPVFRNNFTRRKKVNAGDTNARVDHVDDLGDRWQEYDVYHGNILNYLEKTHDVDASDLTCEDTQNRLKNLFKELPSQFVTSDQVDWKFRVQLQGVEQLFIDHSISSTINLPKGTTSDVVGGIYLEGWKAGLKGVTVYVDGSRDAVLITKDSEKIDPNIRPDKILRIQSPKRPKELQCDIHHHTVRGEKWTALVGLLNGEPYEMFGGYSENIHLPKKYKHGTLKRRARGKYDLIIPVGEEDQLVIRDVVGTFNDDEVGWTTRLMSTALRHGAPIEFMVEQLSKDGGIQAFNKVLARVLKKYIPDGSKVKTNLACENAAVGKCNSPDLVYQEGCVSCVSCGWTKCS